MYLMADTFHSYLDATSSRVCHPQVLYFHPHSAHGGPPSESCEDIEGLGLQYRQTDTKVQVRPGI